MSEQPTIPIDGGWGLLLRDAGIDPDNVLRRAALPETTLSYPGSRLTRTEFYRLWESVEAEADDPLLPVRIADAMSTEAFQPAIFAWLCCPDMVTAVERMACYKRLAGPMTLETDHGPQGLFIGLRWDDPSVALPTTLAAMELAFITRLARIATREHIRPVRIESPCDVGQLTALAPWFGVAPELSVRHGVTFSTADAKRPFLTASNAMWRAFEPELRLELDALTAEPTVAQRVHTVLLEALPSGTVSIDEVSRRLGLSSRTLQRRLSSEGASFKSLVAETRERLARHYLGNPSITYSEISFLLGFEEPTSFHRAFRDWTGTTPETVRAQLTR